MIETDEKRFEHVTNLLKLVNHVNESIYNKKDFFAIFDMYNDNVYLDRQRDEMYNDNTYDSAFRKMYDYTENEIFNDYVSIKDYDNLETTHPTKRTMRLLLNYFTLIVCTLFEDHNGYEESFVNQWSQFDFELIEQILDFQN